jgi:hypothetical protein
MRALGCCTGGEPREAGPGAGRVLSLGPGPGEEERLRRSTRECRWALAAVRAMLEDGRADPGALAGDGTALLYVTAASYGASNRAFIEGGGGTHFAYTAPAVVPAEVAIVHGLHGRSAVYVGGAPATLRAIWQAAAWLRAGDCERAIVLAVETFEECRDLYARGRRLLRWPLVEAAVALWLEPGRGRVGLRGGRAAPRPGAAGAGETGACAPLLALAGRRPGAGASIRLRGRWQGEEAELTWSDDDAA